MQIQIRSAGRAYKYAIVAYDLTIFVDLGQIIHTYIVFKGSTLEQSIHYK